VLERNELNLGSGTDGIEELTDDPGEASEGFVRRDDENRAAGPVDLDGDRRSAGDVLDLLLVKALGLLRDLLRIGVLDLHDAERARLRDDFEILQNRLGLAERHVVARHDQRARRRFGLNQDFDGL